MTRNTELIGASRPVIAFLLGAALIAAGARTAAAEDADEAVAASDAIHEAGMAFERARVVDQAGRAEALAGADRLVDQAIRGAKGRDEVASARYLAGLVRFEAGDPLLAEKEFRAASDKYEKGPFADDADLAAIQSLEAAGRDEDANEAWSKWLDEYPTSPLRGEAYLARAWNALRRGNVDVAHKHLSALLGLVKGAERDPRVAVALGMARYASGQYDAALASLGSTPGPEAVYLRGLCYRATGSVLKSAASFQEVADRYGDSPLRDPALLGKADAFLHARDYRSAGLEFARAIQRASDPHVIAEAELRHAGCVYLAGEADSALGLLRDLTARYPKTDIAARAQFLIGEALASRGQYAEAIVELTRVLTEHFEHQVAASAQYRIGRCLDALDRPQDATGTYQAVVSGYPLEPEAPPAAYRAGVGLLAQNRYRAAAPYFQIVLDRYAAPVDSAQKPVSLSPDRMELIDASLCLLLYSYHRAGDLGQVAGAPHVLLQRMQPSRSPWRAYALLIDANASAAQGRYAEAEETLGRLMREFPDHSVGASATKLLAWTYAKQGRDSLAIAAEERLVRRYGTTGDVELVSSALLDIAHHRFNQKHYKEAAGSYESFLKRFPENPRRHIAHYQAGLCYLRLQRAGDAVDHWEAIVSDSATAPIAERAWARAGDLYFQAQKHEDAKRCYRGLLENFASSGAAALALLRIGQCEYNAGRDPAALEVFSQTISRYPGSPYAREAQRGTELALYRLAQTAKGTETLAQLVEQYPSGAFAADALFQIAKSAYQEKRYTEAAEGFRRVVSQFPGYSSADEAQFLLADAYGRAGAPQEARSGYEQFLAFFPESELRTSARFQLGLLQFEAREYLPAAVAFTQVLGESTTVEIRSAARYNLALCQRELGQTEEAAATLHAYQDEYGADARAGEIAYQLGDLAEAAGRQEEAAQEFERALNSSLKASLETEVAYRLGRAREALGKTDEALRAYRHASKSSDKKNAYRLSAVARCATIYEQQRDFVRALDAYRDIARNAKDQEVASAAAGRATQLEAGTKKR